MENPQFIVAEVSKNWCNGTELQQGGLLCQKFEAVIETNLKRDYILHSWKLDRFTYALEGRVYLNETIIAVFERRK